MAVTRPISALRFACTSAVAVGLLLVFVGSASAQSLSGGCTATIAGRPPSSMTFEDPLVITKGQAVRVDASLPVSNPNARTALKVKVGFISRRDFLKGASYNKDFKPPDWLYTAVDGTVRVEGTATGPGFTCAGSGFIKIDGDGLISLIGGAVLGVGGAAGVASASGPKKPPRESVVPKVENSWGRAVVETIRDIQRELGKDEALSLALVIAVILIFLLIVKLIIL